MLFVLMTAIFAVTRIMPGDPIRALYGPKIPQELYDEIKHDLGLDKPLLDQYVDYITGVLQGNMGVSSFSHYTVLQEISYALPVTLELMIFGTFLSIVIGILSGAIASMNQGKPIDLVIRTASTVSFSIPIFWLSLLLQLFFGRFLGIMPLSGRIDILMEPTRITGMYTIDSILTLNVAALGNSLWHLILPGLAICSYLSAVISKITRANMANVINADFVTVLKAKGLPTRTILYKHVLKNSILPILTITTMLFAAGLGGSVLIETVFSLPGLGKLILTSIVNRDFPLISGATTVFAIAVIILTTFVDIFHALIDPRARR